MSRAGPAIILSWLPLANVAAGVWYPREDTLQTLQPVPPKPIYQYISYA